MFQGKASALQFNIYGLLIACFSLTGTNVLNLTHFLSRAKPSSDLRELMLKYTPLQTPWAYDTIYWHQEVLDVVRKMV